MVSGADALRALEYLCSAKVDRPVGSCIYSLMLNREGGIEADLIVTRMVIYILQRKLFNLSILIVFSFTSNPRPRTPFTLQWDLPLPGMS